MENKRKVVGLYGGSFKPPTKGHFEVVKTAFEQNPNLDHFNLYVGTQVRDGVTLSQSILIWEIYSKYLPISFKIVPTSNEVTPIRSIYRYAKNNPEMECYFFIGAREGNDGDYKDIKIRTRGVDKIPNLEVKVIETKDNQVSGTRLRNALKDKDEETFKSLLPAELNEDDVNKIFEILNFFGDREEEEEVINESTIPTINLEEKIKELNQYYIDNSYNVEPLPKVEFIDDDISNSESFTGKTAFYDPYDKIIVLYTLNRHPKDIIRSYSHELVHHIQNLENRLGNITTTNTHEDENLANLESEANLTGTMVFRNWTDKMLNENMNTRWLDLNGYLDSIFRDLGVDIEFTKHFKQRVKQRNLKDGEIVDLMQKIHDHYGEKIEDLPKNARLVLSHLSKLIDIVVVGGDEPNEKDKKEIDLITAFKRDNSEEDPFRNVKDTPQLKVNELADKELKYWALYSKIFDLLNNKDYKKVYKKLSLKLKGESLNALNYFYNEYFVKNPNTIPLSEGKYDSIVTQVSSDIFNSWKESYNGKDRTIYSNEYAQMKTEKNPIPLVFEVTAELLLIPDAEYGITGGADEGNKKNIGYVELRCQVDPKDIPSRWEQISMDLKDVVRHEIEHLTQGGYNLQRSKEMDDDSSLRAMIDILGVLPRKEYYKLEKEIDAMLQGLYLKAKKSKTPFKEVIKKYLDDEGLSKEEQREILKVWKNRSKALNLPLQEKTGDPFGLKAYAYELSRLDESETPFTVYFDMDGVIADFEKQFKNYSGMESYEYEKKYSTQGFWDIVNKGGVRYWKDIPLMPNAKKLIEAAGNNHYELLTAPSREQSSYLGKILWVRKNKFIFGGKEPHINFKSAENKTNVKSSLSETDILVDDREDTIERWRAAGGTGIHYVSSLQAINELKSILNTQ